MAYFFTLLYLLTAYMTPPVLFGPLSEYHVEIFVVLLAIFSSLPNLPGCGLLRAPQMLGLAGISFSIAASIAQSGWLGGIAGPIYGFMQPVFAFGLVAVNCKKRWHLQWIFLLFIVGSIYFMLHGFQDLQANVSPSEYLYGEGALRRLRGLGFVHDPNDLSQVLVSMIPAVFLWRKKNALDIVLLGVPIAVLIWGMYLTHSRGAMLALFVVVLLASRRKIGAIPAAILSGGLLAGLFAVGWSGGRDVSMDAGADRLDLWYDGIEMIKAHPLFGIGLNGFADKFGITAHNSIVICASELGIVGLYFWTLFVFSTMRRAVLLGRGVKGEAPEEAVEEMPRHPAKRRRLESAEAPPAAVIASVLPPPRAPLRPPGGSDPAKNGKPLSFGVLDEDTTEDTREMATILFLSLAGLLTAGWFLSRALSIWLFMYCGMVYAVSRMNSATEIPPQDKLSWLARWSGVVTVGLLFVLYIILRARNFS